MEVLPGVFGEILEAMKSLLILRRRNVVADRLSASASYVAGRVDVFHRGSGRISSISWSDGLVEIGFEEELIELGQFDISHAEFLRPFSPQIREQQMFMRHPVDCYIDRIHGFLIHLTSG